MNAPLSRDQQVPGWQKELQRTKLTKQLEYMIFLDEQEEDKWKCTIRALLDALARLIYHDA